MRIVIIVAVLALATPAYADTLSGRASVVDGDTIEIHGQRIRLWGVDAPESSQSCTDATGAQYRCGQRAALALADWLGQHTVACDPRGKSYDRLVAVCRVGGQDIAAWLVTNGYAVDWPRYSKGAYAPQQAEAEAANAGIWAGPFRLEKSGVSGE